MNEFLRKLRNLIEQQRTLGKSSREISIKVKRFIAANPIERIMPDVRNINIDEFIKTFGATEADIAAISTRIAPIVEQSEKASDNFKPSVLKAVHKGLEIAAKKGLEGDFREYAREVLRPVIKNANHIETEIEAAQAALDVASNIEAARRAGYEFFRYVGPAAGLRDFCAQHLGRVYHISEIEVMDNGQKLSVLYYRGGYNCRHDWNVVSADVARQERPDWF